MLTITVEHPSLPAALQMQIADGNGYEDNARALGWEDRIHPTEKQLDKKRQAILDAPAGSRERLDAQRALQEFEVSTTPNPVSALQFLIHHLRTHIEAVLVDQEAKAAAQQAAVEAVEEQFKQQVGERVNVVPVPAAPPE